MRAKRSVSLAEGDRIFRKEDRKKILYEKLQQMPINISARLLKKIGSHCGLEELTVTFSKLRSLGTRFGVVQPMFVLTFF